MIAMRIFITFLLALDFISPIEIITSKDETRTEKVAEWIFSTLIVAGIAFVWII